jgi:hypothetical protein
VGLGEYSVTGVDFCLYGDMDFLYGCTLLLPVVIYMLLFTKI